MTITVICDRQLCGILLSPLNAAGIAATTIATAARVAALRQGSVKPMTEPGEPALVAALLAGKAR
jgi:hypothetical protein